MRSLAIARFRVINAVRSTDWVYAFAAVFAVLPVLGAELTAGFDWSGDLMVITVRPFAVMFHAVYMIHALILASASQLLLGPRHAWGEYVQVTDLFEAAPVDARTRLVGDALGIAAALAAIHLAIMPVIVYAFLMSPHGWGVFAALEAALVAFIVFFSVVAAATGREHATAWQRTRSIRVVATVAFLVLGALAVATKLRAFRDAFGDLLAEGSPRAWSALLSTVHNPLLFQVLICTIFLGTIVYLYLQAADPRAQGDYR